jgi:hypothetical protein
VALKQDAHDSKCSLFTTGKCDCYPTDEAATFLIRDLRMRIADLEDALRRVVRDVNDYEETNKLSPNPGRTECWDSVAHAKAVLQKSTVPR